MPTTTYKETFRDLEDPASLQQMATELTTLKLRHNFSQVAGHHRFHIRATPNNPESSRSHMMITTQIEDKRSGAVLGKISLLDMAGSENPDAIKDSYFSTRTVPVKDIFVNDQSGTTKEKLELSENITSVIKNAIKSRNTVNVSVNFNDLQTDIGKVCDTLLHVFTMTDGRKEADVIVMDSWAQLLASQSDFTRDEVTRVLMCPPSVPNIIAIVDARLTIAAEIKGWLDFAEGISTTDANEDTLIALANKYVPYMKTFNSNFSSILTNPQTKYDKSTLAHVNWMKTCAYNEKQGTLWPAYTAVDTFIRQMTIQITMRVVQLWSMDRVCLHQLETACADYVVAKDKLNNDLVNAAQSSSTDIRITLMHAIWSEIESKYLNDMIAPLTLPDVQAAKKLMQQPSNPPPQLNPRSNVEIKKRFLAESGAETVKMLFVTQHRRGLMWDHVKSTQTPPMPREMERTTPLEDMRSQLKAIASTTLREGGWTTVMGARGFAKQCYDESEAAKRRLHCPLLRQGIFINHSIDDIRAFVTNVNEAEKLDRYTAPARSKWLADMFGHADERFRFMQVAAVRSDFRWTCADAKGAADPDRETRIRNGTRDTLTFAQSVNSFGRSAQ